MLSFAENFERITIEDLNLTTRHMYEAAGRQPAQRPLRHVGYCAQPGG